ncbi:nuclear transport factor 2 family protein [Flavobacterium sp. XGLA_31]|uniref:nuclear transport factor 2 family protein n=1 Tax=Flavobacterium sp. XGLA_31 TaxID=3447666 RepID=UPI003F2DA0A7
MNIKKLVTDWLDVSNSYDTQKYLEKYAADAVLNDPSVGRKFVGHEGIREYYTTYFIGYKTQTRLVKVTLEGHTAHLEVDFTGEFPGGQIGGLFELTFKEGKIVNAQADLM